MAGEVAEARERLFNLYSRNMAHYDADVGDAFVCPLCLRVFPRWALTSDPPLLSLAHVVPAAFGGTVGTGTLACAQCNKQVGAELESFLVNQFRHEDWLAGVGETNARLRTSQGEIGVQFKLETDQGRPKWTIRVVAKQSNPADVKRVQEWMTGNGGKPATGEQFQFRWRAKLFPRRARGALYHAAYLLVFRHFGYEAVVHPHFRHLREWIMDPKNDSWPSRMMVLGEETAEAILEGRRQGLLFLRAPRVLMAVFRFQPREGRSRVLGVVLPGLDSPEVPEVQVGPFDCAIVPYDPDALTDGPWQMHYHWVSYHRGASEGGS